MKLTIYILSFAFFIAAGASAWSDTPGYQKQLREERNIYKRAGVVKEIRFMNESGKLDYNAQIIRVRYYDNKGRLTLDSNMADEGDFGVEYDRYTYNKSGYLIKMEMFGYDMVTLVHTYKYDKEGKLIESYFASAEARKYIYKYDNKGYMTEQIGYAYFPSDKSDKLVEKLWEKKTFEYDKNYRQKRIVHWRYTPSDSKKWTIEFEENFVYKNGRIYEASAYHHEYDIKNTAVFFYNKKGLIQKTAPRDDAGQLKKQFTQYFHYEYK